MFEPPMDHCPVCGEYVLLVQTQAECACRHKCSPNTPCPLRKSFATTDFYGDGDAPSPIKRTR